MVCADGHLVAALWGGRCWVKWQERIRYEGK